MRAIALLLVVFDALEPRGSKWHRFKWLGLVGCYLLMMFYTVVCGWTLAYFLKTATGELGPTADIAGVFNSLLANPFEMTRLDAAGHGYWIWGVCPRGSKRYSSELQKA